MNLPFRGGCACGAIRDQYTAEPMSMFNCHCRDCQRATGAGHACVVVVPAAALKVTSGERSYHFTASAAIGRHKRGFCAECGSRLTGGENRQGTSEIVGINAGVVWTILVGSSRNTTSSPRTHSHGTKWIPRFQNTRSIRRDKTGDMPLSLSSAIPVHGLCSPSTWDFGRRTPGCDDPFMDGRLGSVTRSAERRRVPKRHSVAVR